PLTRTGPRSRRLPAAAPAGAVVPAAPVPAPLQLFDQHGDGIERRLVRPQRPRGCSTSSPLWPRLGRDCPGRGEGGLVCPRVDPPGTRGHSRLPPLGARTHQIWQSEPNTPQVSTTADCRLTPGLFEWQSGACWTAGFDGVGGAAAE